MKQGQQGWQLRRTGLWLMLVLMTTVSGCAGWKAVGACDVFRPISVLETDDPQTVREVDEHNIRWDMYCGR